MIWAVLGPVVVGAISAMWHRKNQVTDKKLASAELEKAGNKALSKELKERQVALKKESLSLFKTLLLDFVNSGQQAFNSAGTINNAIRIAPQNTHQHLQEVVDGSHGMTINFNKLLLHIPTDEIKNAAIELLNTVSTAITSAGAEGSMPQNSVDQYKIKKSALLALGCDYVKGQELQISQLISDESTT